MTDYLRKLTQLDQQLNNSTVHDQVTEIKQIIGFVQQKEVIKKAPAKLGLQPDQFEDILTEVGNDKRKKLAALNHLLNGLRQYLSLRFGIWSLPNLKTAKLLKEDLNINSCLEIMAGNAYWSKALNEVGIKTIATDSLEWAKTSKTGSSKFFPVANLSAIEAIKKYPNFDLILCSWSPNFGKNDIEVINTWRRISKSKLIFIGEKNGATNSSEFWQKSEFVKSNSIKKINHSFQSFDFINEKFYEIEKL